MDPSSSLSRSTEDAVEEIMKTHRSLPARPRTEEVEAALTVVENADKEESSRLEAFSSSSSSRKSKGSSFIPEELLTILQEMRKSIVSFECKEKKRDALKLLELEKIHVLFDDFILKTSNCISSSNKSRDASSSSSSSKNFVSSSSLFDKEGVEIKEKKGSKLAIFTRDDSYLVNNKAMSTFKFNTDAYAIGNKLLSSKPSIVDNSSMKHASTSGKSIILVEKLLTNIVVVIKFV